MKVLKGKRLVVSALVIALCLVPMMVGTARAWEPKKPITVVIPYARGGADVIGRFIQSVVGKYGFCKQPLIVVNKDGG